MIKTLICLAILFLCFFNIKAQGWKQDTTTVRKGFGIYQSSFLTAQTGLELSTEVLYYRNKHAWGAGIVYAQLIGLNINYTNTIGLFRTQTFFLGYDFVYTYYYHPKHNPDYKIMAVQNLFNIGFKLLLRKHFYINWAAGIGYSHAWFTYEDRWIYVKYRDNSLPFLNKLDRKLKLGFIPFNNYILKTGIVYLFP